MLSHRWRRLSGQLTLIPCTRHIQRKWADAEENYEAIYKLQQQEIDHLTKKLSLAHLR
jgi:hypothetical protein